MRQGILTNKSKCKFAELKPDVLDAQVSQSTIIHKNISRVRERQKLAANGIKYH
jgi:hypothetical protein